MYGRGTSPRILGTHRLIVLALTGLFIGLVPFAAAARLLGDGAQARDWTAAIGGDVSDSSVTVTCGMPKHQVAAPVTGLNSPDPAVKAEAPEPLRLRLHRETRSRIEAIAQCFEILGWERVESEKLSATFARIAEEHLLLREQAAEALERADQDAAREHPEAARQLVKVKREALRAALIEQARAVAYRANIEERTRERDPLLWTTTQSNIGKAPRVDWISLSILIKRFLEIRHG